MKTFEELINEVGAATVYSGTDVDEATQGALLEWLFDRYLSMYDGDEQKWIRRFRRQLNMFYPMYMDYLRVQDVRASMDPFITEFMERVHSGEATSTNGDTTTKSVTGSTSGSDRTITDDRTVRTPNLATDTINNNTRTDNLANSSTSTDTGTVGNVGTVDITDNGKTRGMNIAYPEANMGSIPQTIDNFPTDISYASGETDGFNRNIRDEDTSSTETRNLQSTTSGTQTGTVSDSGTGRVTETGTETTDFDGDVTKTTTGSNTSSESITNAGTDARSDRSEEIEQGRHASIAELLPKAVSAITSTNAIKFLVNNLLVCFDNYSEL